MLFKIAQIISIHLGYFCGKNCHQGTFKNCPIWSHWKGRKISLVQIFSILRNIVNWQLWLNGAWGKSLTPSNSLVVSSANPAEKNLLNTNLIIHFSPHSATQREGMHWVLFNVVLIDANEQKIKRERERRSQSVLQHYRLNYDAANDSPLSSYLNAQNVWKAKISQLSSILYMFYDRNNII